ncbi:hypothetical protein D3C84_1119380 [compost metagenome]
MHRRIHCILQGGRRQRAAIGHAGGHFQAGELAVEAGVTDIVTQNLECVTAILQLLAAARQFAVALAGTDDHVRHAEQEHHADCEGDHNFDEGKAALLSSHPT